MNLSQSSPIRDTIFIPYTFSKSINPYQIFWSGDWAASRHSWLPLLDLNSSGQPYPILAKSWVSSPDNTLWSFKIKKNLKWSDGSKMSLDQIVKSLNRSMEGTSHSNLSKSIKLISHDNVDTIEIKLKRPVPQILIYLSYVDWAIVHPDSVESTNDGYVIKSYDMISGPYQIVKSTKNSVSFKPNPYSAQADNLDLKEYDLRVYKTCDELKVFESRILSFRMYSDTASSDCLKYFTDRGYTIRKSTPTWVHNLAFTVSAEAKLPLQVRKALLTRVIKSYGLKKVGIEQATGVLTNHIFGYLPLPKFNEKLLEIESNTKNIQLKDIQITILNREDWANWISYKEAKQALTSTGVKIKEIILDEQAYKKAVAANELHKIADIIFIPLGVGDPDPDGSWRFANTSILQKRVDEMKLDQAYFERDTKKRLEIYNNLALSLLEKAIFIPLSIDVEYIGIHSSVEVDTSISFGTGMFLYELKKNNK